jgi:hypothetical protein
MLIAGILQARFALSSRKARSSSPAGARSPIPSLFNCSESAEGFMGNGVTQRAAGFPTGEILRLSCLCGKVVALLARIGMLP